MSGSGRVGLGQVRQWSSLLGLGWAVIEAGLSWALVGLGQVGSSRAVGRQWVGWHWAACSGRVECWHVRG